MVCILSIVLGATQWSDRGIEYMSSGNVAARYVANPPGRAAPTGAPAVQKLESLHHNGKYATDLMGSQLD